MKKILVIGSTNIDYVIHVNDTPVIGETIMSKSFGKYPGGKGANQAYACGRLGGNVSFMSVIGDDDIGKIALKNLKDVNVNLECVRTVEGFPTGMAIICVNNEGDNCIMVIPGANALCDKEYIEEHLDWIRETDILVIQMETPEEGVYFALEKAKEFGKLILFNPAPVSQDIPKYIFSGLSYITLNETELQKLTGMCVDTLEEICTAAKKLLEWGVRNVIVTMGAKGAIFINDKAENIFAPFTVKPVDTTAAGDTFNAAVAVKLSEGATIDEAIVFANAAASISVTRKGAQTSIPSRQEVEVKRYIR